MSHHRALAKKRMREDEDIDFSGINFATTSKGIVPFIRTPPTGANKKFLEKLVKSGCSLHYKPELNGSCDRCAIIHNAKVWLDLVADMKYCGECDILYEQTLKECPCGGE